MWLPVRRAIVMGLCLGVVFMSVMTILGYATGMPHLARWTGDGTVPMALNTALCFLLTAVAVFLLALNGSGGGPFVKAP